MLVLSRKVGERILIGDNISVTVVRITGGGVRLGVEAPPDMAVIRQELKDRLDAERAATPNLPLKTTGT
jgi:carbon storage regulator